MADNVSLASRGLAISGAFIGQAGTFAGAGAARMHGNGPTEFARDERYQDARQPLRPGPYTFAADWPAGELKPGTRWQVYVTGDSAGASVGSAMSTVTVTSRGRPRPR
jgi:hypothetical protein